MGLNPTRTCFVRVLERMGASLGFRIERMELGEPVGTLEVEPGPRLAGTTIEAAELPLVIDEVPVLAMMAAHASGQTRFEGAAELRVKESDRLGGLVEAIRALGGDADLEGDDLVVGGDGLAGARRRREAIIGWRWPWPWPPSRREVRSPSTGSRRPRCPSPGSRSSSRSAPGSRCRRDDGDRDRRGRGAGKSTLAHRLATELGLPYVNTGLMYRALALRAHREGVSPEDAPALDRLARGIRFELDSSVRPPELRIDGEPPDPALTSAEVESSVSAVARHPEVREVLRREQRRLAADGAVMEGRDIGSVVAPDADLKLFLRAHRDERVGRRALERDKDPERVARALGTRDRQDARTNPFVPAPDAFVLDTTELSPDEVAHQALALIRERGLAP